VTRLVSAELLKLRTIRSPLGLLLGVLLLAALALAGNIASGGLDADPERIGLLVQASAAGLAFATLLGIVAVTNEFRHGTIVQTFLLEPVRERVVAAKTAAGLVGGAVFGVAVAIATLAVAIPWLASRGASLPIDGELLFALVRLVVGFALAGALGIAVGFLIRSQVGAIVTALAWFLVAEPLLALLGFALWRNEWGRSPVDPYLPGSAFDAFVTGGAGDYISAPRALAVLAAYVVGLLALALLATRRRDAL
jgi:ABC-2 type transport system permease protein